MGLAQFLLIIIAQLSGGRMFTNRKKTLFVALAGLLASSTAVVALVAHPGTSDSTARAVSPEATEAVNGTVAATEAEEPASYSAAGCSASVDGACESSLPASGDGAPVDFSVDRSLEIYSPLADVIEATQSAAGQSDFGNGFGAPEDLVALNPSQLTANISDQSGGSYAMASLQRQFQLDSFGSLSDFNSLLSFSSSGRSAGPITRGPDSAAPGGSDTGGTGTTPIGGGTGTPISEGNDGPSSGGDNAPQESPCDVFTGCASSGYVPGTAPNTPIGGSDGATSVPEPGSLGLLALGLALAAGMRRRRHA
jgi:hypothetical protein